MRSIFKESRSSSRRNNRRQDRHQQHQESAALSSNDEVLSRGPPSSLHEEAASIGATSAANKNNRRRQQLSFLKYGEGAGPAKSKRSESSIHRSREHARQIAMKMSQEGPPVVAPSNSNSKIAAFADFNSAFGQEFGSPPQQQQPPPPASKMFLNHPETESMASDSSSSFFEQDPFGTAAASALAAQPIPQPATRRRSASRESSRRAQPEPFVADWSAPDVPPLRPQKQPQPQQQQSSSSVVHIKQHVDGSYHRQTPAASSDSRNSSSKPGLSSAAARRRVRTQMRSTSVERSVASSAASSTTHGREPSMPQPMGRLGNFVASNSGGNGMTRETSARSVASSAASSTPGGLDSMLLDHAAGTEHRPGFTFDAFGLDASQMNDQFDQAMHDLAGSHPEILARGSPFFAAPDLGQSSRAPSSAGGWDTTSSANTSPTPSRSSTPPLMMPLEESQNGFVDGFRVTSSSSSQQQQQQNQPKRHGQSSPSGSITERSTASGESPAPGQAPAASSTINLREKARKSAALQRSGSHTSMQPNKFTARTSRVALQQPQQSLPSNRSKENIQFVDDDNALGGETDMMPQPQYRSAQSEVGLPSADFMEIRGQTRTAASDVGFVNSEVGAPSDVGTGITAPSDVGVSSEVDGSAQHGLDDLVPLRVFSRDKSSPSAKSLRNTANKGSEDTATTASTTYSSQFEEKKEEQERQQQEQNSSAPLTQKHLDALQSQFGETLEILSPEIIEQRRKQEHLEKRQRLRQEYSVPDPIQPNAPSTAPFPRTSPSRYQNRSSPRHNSNNNYNRDIHAAKSEGGILARDQADVVSSAMDRLDLSAVRSADYHNPHSDAGAATPEFMNIKLRQTHSGGGDAEVSNQENVGPVNSYGSAGSSGKKPQPPQTMDEGQSLGRTLSYRERRELEKQEQFEREQMEHQKQQQEQEQYEREQYERQQQEQYERQQHQQMEQEPQQNTEVVKRAERDVASLIQRRIAANRRSTEEPTEQEHPNAMPMPHMDEGPQQDLAGQPSYDELPVLAPRFEGGQGPGALSMPGPPGGLFEQPPSSPAKKSRPQKEPEMPKPQEEVEEEPPLDPRAAMMKALQMRGAPAPVAPAVEEPPLDPRAAMMKALEMRGAPAAANPPPPQKSNSMEQPTSLENVRTSSNLAEPATKSTTPKATKMMLNAFLAGRGDGGPVAKKPAAADDQTAAGDSTFSRPALKDDPEYERYFKMLKLGMPMEVVKHALERDGLDPAVMDGDHNKPVVVGVPLKEDPEFQKYFKMLKMGMPVDAVKHSMIRDGLDGAILDQDHNLPIQRKAKKKEEESQAEKDSHRRARLHWKTLRKVTSNSLWAKLDQDDALGNIEIDEGEFQELFQVEKGEEKVTKKAASAKSDKAVTVRVIDPKRANNGGIILARLKMSHDDMADAVDRINENALTAEQIENIIEYLPSKEERKALESYMLEGGQDAAEKFDGLCECEKFMVSMMTVKHAKQKVRALLFKLQFEQCLDDILQDTLVVETACDELSNSVRLRQLLGIVLTFGNRLNTAGNKKRKAGAFTLDSLLKLSQAKAFDKKTTFLHYIVLIVQRNNEILLNFKDDLEHVFKADKVFWDQCLTDLDEVEGQLENVRRIALYQARHAHGYLPRRTKKKEEDDDSLSDGDISLSLEEEVEALRATPIGVFTLSAIKYVSSLRDKVDDTRAKYRSLLEYFGEEEETMQPHELFTIIANFCRDFTKAKEEVMANEKKKQREERKRAQTKSPAGKPPTHSTPDRRPQQQQKPQHKTMLRASSLQPSISAVMKQNQGSERDNRSGARPSGSGEASPHPSNGNPETAHYSNSKPQVPLHDQRRVEPNERQINREHAQQNPAAHSDSHQNQSPLRTNNNSTNGVRSHSPGPSNRPRTPTRQYPQANQASTQGDSQYSHAPKSPGRGQQAPPKSPGIGPHRNQVMPPQMPMPQYSQGQSQYEEQQYVEKQRQQEYEEEQRQQQHQAEQERQQQLYADQQRQHAEQQRQQQQYAEQQRQHAEQQRQQQQYAEQQRLQQFEEQQRQQQQRQQQYEEQQRQQQYAEQQRQQQQLLAEQQHQKQEQSGANQAAAISHEQAAATSTRGKAAIATLRQKARMKKMQQHRGPPVHSNSAPADLGPATPTASSPSAPVAAKSQPSNNTTSSQPKQQMSPRSSFRHRRRMEARERMRQGTQGNN